MQRIAVVALTIALAGCATTQRTSFPPPEGPASPTVPSPQPGEEQPRPPQRPSKPEVMPPRSAQEASSPAVLSLLGRADTLARNGNMDMAAATLERALDLEPRNAFVYQRLAAVKLAQGQGGQAEAMARKSNSVAGDNPFVRADNWRLIAEARRADGDRSGADEAMQRASSYRSASQQFMR
ncbi:tetratricopeptide repeat protein [Salinisphaera sp. C84B14]|uniref:tetratricopeptide repeat protein n=1 Tax=Salinisphaera sp. C84B14 TaxID=1304155 RepID=UPI003340836A